MKIQSTNLLVKLSTKTILELTTQVKETLAMDVKTPEKCFTAANLWNIQRQRKSVSIRRFA